MSYYELAEANTVKALRIMELEARLAEAERDDEQAMKERDYNEEMADRLAAAIATLTGVDIGEHSSGNCPWHAALEAAEEHGPTVSASSQAFSRPPHCEHHGRSIIPWCPECQRFVEQRATDSASVHHPGCRDGECHPGCNASTMDAAP